MGEGIRIDVYLPARGSAGRGGLRTRASVVLRAADGGAERLDVPVAVGRRFDRARKDAPGLSSSREAALEALGRVERSCAHDRMEALVNRREYSRKELSDRLLEDGYPAALVDELVGRAAEAGVVDDARFAAGFVATKLAAGWGMARIARELGRRGVDVEALPGWPYDFLDPDDEYERALALARRRRLSGKNDVPKTARFLAGRGFSGDVAFRAARAAVREATDGELDS